MSGTVAGAEALAGRAAGPDAGADPAAPDPADRAVRARRIDWRFVLPDPTPGRVAWIGPDDDAAAAALREAGWQVLGPGDPVALEADLVVVVTATSADLETGIGLVRPGGTILVTTGTPRRRLGRHGRRARMLAPAGVAARLGAAGFASIRLQVHAPSQARRSAIVPLDDAAAVRLFLVHHGGPAASRAATALAEVGRRTGWLARLAPSVSVVASRGVPGDGRVPGEGSRDALSTHLASVTADGGRRPAPLLLTPSFRASRHVVALLPASDGRSATVVAKVARIADSGQVTDREAAVLRVLEAAPPIVRDGAPRCLSVGRPWGLATLVESGVDGAPLDPATVRRDPDRALGLVLPWLGALVLDRRVARPAGERLARLLERPLLAYERAAGSNDDERLRIARTREVIDGLRAIALPVVIEHGDVSHPNLLVRPDGRIGAVDWELGEPEGLPGHDLTGFLGYVALARSGATTAGDQARALRALLLGQTPWAEAAGQAYARDLGVDPDLLPALAVVGWARRAIGLAERLHDGIPATLDPGTAAWIRAHRFSAGWTAAIERVELGRVR